MFFVKKIMSVDFSAAKVVKPIPDDMVGSIEEGIQALAEELDHIPSRTLATSKSRKLLPISKLFIITSIISINLPFFTQRCILKNYSLVKQVIFHVQLL